MVCAPTHAAGQDWRTLETLQRTTWPIATFEGCKEPDCPPGQVASEVRIFFIGADSQDVFGTATARWDDAPQAFADQDQATTLVRDAFVAASPEGGYEAWQATPEAHVPFWRVDLLDTGNADGSADAWGLVEGRHRSVVYLATDRDLDGPTLTAPTLSAAAAPTEAALADYVSPVSARIALKLGGILYAHGASPESVARAGEWIPAAPAANPGHILTLLSRLPDARDFSLGGPWGLMLAYAETQGCDGCAPPRAYIAVMYR